MDVHKVRQAVLFMRTNCSNNTFRSSWKTRRRQLVKSYLTSQLVSPATIVSNPDDNRAELGILDDPISSTLSELLPLVRETDSKPETDQIVAAPAVADGGGPERQGEKAVTETEHREREDCNDKSMKRIREQPSRRVKVRAR